MLEHTCGNNGSDRALIERARAFALGAHAALNQRRKYTDEPYSVHLAEVAELVSRAKDVTAEMVAVAWLHDTVEDTAIPLTLIETEFGKRVGRLVGELTAISTPDGGDRAARKARDRAHTAQASATAQTIKAADLLSNLRTVEDRDPQFAAIYMREKRLLLDVLTQADECLRNDVRAIIDDYFTRQGTDELA
ncbi:bifunctional (p)ppGpp synthetase/guanosine-3',5'-bis(diphosphate) 3'-pyrophosphohydrolase [Burkholderia sp. R-69927]|nr:bifunctional (p)ppGpp synthetase/guanosine-3',5'-bis(diphosphate) 3'-pyrophosphohydrolase [Burkholderia sp. R-70006]MBK5059063.1 bifunctional (p)ppGpp synthetase/guanosine-3',5'-bis(diphosphate) 3'-pyrophosphohydrolase [Burkholderia sp. R-70199]MBK5086077.1 bifunctional (p)ppGpp synthetase/guanosine-3',5'-bis(diphosphate) 3'-pyrophosphohydrolase [Burkholderia sp. R-69927]MBK5119104.1 bifunctional (p)ppGpp synthetase/guanosine-3',5'-bis(diphosphate) 3'-pyrophosphohydrolase [Burkholderia sp. R-